MQAGGREGPGAQRDARRGHRGAGGKLIARPERRFLFRLALALGKTVGELTGSLSSRELTEWRAFASLESLGEERADLRMAILASSLVNLQAPKGRRSKPADFLPRWACDARSDLNAKVRAVMANLGAR